MDIELRHLRYFLAVAEEGHITRAAERLGIQQPPLSQRIRAIERTLGAQLFRRKARGVELTQAGEAFLAHARTLLAQYDLAIESSRRAARGEQGRLTIGVTPTAPFHPFVPRVIRAYRDAYPQVSITLEECLRTELLARLRDERTDVAFLRASIAEPEGLAVHPLLVESMAVALPAGHALARAARGQPLPMKALADETFIVYARTHGPALYEATLAACRRAGFSPRLGQEAPRVTSALGLVAAGLGIAVVPASMQGMRMTGVTYRRLKSEPALRAVLDIAARRTDTSPIVRRFIAIARQAAKTWKGEPS